jgi:hypothetical protein
VYTDFYEELKDIIKSMMPVADVGKEHLAKIGGNTNTWRSVANKISRDLGIRYMSINDVVIFYSNEPSTPESRRKAISKL